MNAIDIEKMSRTIADNPVRPTMPMRSNPAIVLGEPTGPIDSALGSVVAKHRELVDAVGDLPQRTLVGFRDKARQTNATNHWNRVEAALYALIGDPE